MAGWILDILRTLRLMPTPPPPPKAPDVTRIPMPHQLRLIPNARLSWTQAMESLQADVDRFCKTLSDGVWWDGFRTAGPYFLIIGIIVGAWVWSQVLNHIAKRITLTAAAQAAVQAAIAGQANAINAANAVNVQPTGYPIPPTK